MTSPQKPVMIIPARGGSRRIPGKNIRDFHGRPIISYSIEHGLDRALFGAVYVSTDSDQIAEVSINAGAKVIVRPPELALDSVGTQEVTRHAIKHLGLEDTTVVCCMYATSPLTQRKDLYCGLTLEWARPSVFVVAVGIDPLRDAGQWYIGSAHAFTQDYPLYGVRSSVYDVGPWRCCDINTEADWQRAEILYAAHRDGLRVIGHFHMGDKGP
ncbi:MAG TPA: hypothetical protein VMU55_06520 [Solirubrobacteraceae bacterium]|nr:hypothetical protein [Solirubrobacteraceae bacterium]